MQKPPIRDMLKRASGPNLRKVFILDPNSATLRSIYKQTMQVANIHCLAGLPEGVPQLYDLALNELKDPRKKHAATETSLTSPQEAHGATPGRSLVKGKGSSQNEALRRREEEAYWTTFTFSP